MQPPNVSDRTPWNHLTSVTTHHETTSCQSPSHHATTSCQSFAHHATTSRQSVISLRRCCCLCFTCTPCNHLTSVTPLIVAVCASHTHTHTHTHTPTSRQPPAHYATPHVSHSHTMQPPHLSHPSQCCCLCFTRTPSNHPTSVTPLAALCDAVCVFPRLCFTCRVNSLCFGWLTGISGSGVIVESRAAFWAALRFLVPIFPASRK